MNDAQSSRRRVKTQKFIVTIQGCFTFSVLAENAAEAEARCRSLATEARRTPEKVLVVSIDRLAISPFDRKGIIT